MSRLDELIQELCPDGVEQLKISEVTNYEQPSKYIVNSTDYSDDFETPVLTAGQTFILGYTNETDGIYKASKDNPVIIFDDFTGALKWVDFPFKIKSSAMKLITANNKILIRYLYYTMENIGFSSNEHKRLWISIYSEMKIPVPPLEVQREIVRILDSFTLLTAELTARQKQYDFYRNKLLINENTAVIKPLGDICTLVRGPFGGSLKKECFVSDGYAVYEQQHAIYDDFSNFRYFIDDTKYAELKRFSVNPGDMIMSCSGTMGKIAIVPDDAPKGVINQALLKITVGPEVDRKYLKYCFENTVSKQMNDNARGGAIKNVASVAELKQTMIAVPPIEAQKRLVKVLDNFDAICSDLNIGLPAEIEARQKQYEYYRDALLTYAATGKIIAQTDRQTDKYDALIKLCQYVFGYAPVKLGEIATLITGATPSTLKQEYWDNGTISWMSSGEVNLKRVFNTEQKITQDGYNSTSTYLVPVHSIVIALAGQGKTRGKVAITEIELCTNQSLCSIVCNELVNYKYLYYYLDSKYEELRAISNGDGTRGGLSLKLLKPYGLVLPSLKEQERIVSILDRFDALCHDISTGLPAEIEARQKQYEYYRDKLLNFKKLEK